MRNVLILAIIIMTSCASDKRPDFTLYGKLKNLDGSVFRLIKDGKVYDIDTVKNGSFILQARLPNLELVMVDVRKDISNVGKPTNWIGAGSYLVDRREFYMLTANGLGDLLNHEQKVITSSGHQRQFDRIREWKNKRLLLYKQKAEEMELTRTSYLKKGDTVRYSVYTDSITTLQNQSTTIREAVNDFLFHNPNTYAAIYSMSTSATLKEDLDFYKTIYSKLKSKYRNHKYARIYKQKSDQMEKLLTNQKL